jgi:hypothetical protein
MLTVEWRLECDIDYAFTRGNRWDANICNICSFIGKITDITFRYPLLHLCCVFVNRLYVFIMVVKYGYYLLFAY